MNPCGITKKQEAQHILLAIKEREENQSTPNGAVALFVTDQFGGLNRAEEAGACSFAAWLTREGFTLHRGKSSRRHRKGTKASH